MQVYIFQADIYCAPCGEAIRERINSQYAASAAAGPIFPVVPALRLKLATQNPAESEDSEDYPQGPYSSGGGEADCPQHCGACREFLENPLTSDGVEYVREKLAEGSGVPEVLKAWSDFYGITAEEATNAGKLASLVAELLEGEEFGEGAYLQLGARRELPGGVVELTFDPIPHYAAKARLPSLTIQVREALPQFYECGICGHFHPATWDGDCRDDANRYTSDRLEQEHGEEGKGWEEVSMPGEEKMVSEL